MSTERRARPAFALAQLNLASSREDLPVPCQDELGLCTGHG